MKKLKISKKFGVWFYEKVTPNCYNDLDAPIYELYDCNKEHVETFPYYGDMKLAIEYGDIEKWICIYG